MADEQKIENAMAAYAKFRELQSRYFQLSTDYAKALGAGTATETARLQLVAAKTAYYSA